MLCRKGRDERSSVSLLQSVREHFSSSARRILVVGPTGSGKTTFSVSASKFAGDTVQGGRRVCSDVAVLSGDNEGVLGAVDAGLVPGLIIDMTTTQYWDALPPGNKGDAAELVYKVRLQQAIAELLPKIRAGEISVVVLDLALPSRLIVDKVKPSSIADWGAVSSLGSILYTAMGALRGATVIGNNQLKSAVAAVENEVAAAAAEARAIGGERNRFTSDLPKGVNAIWVENSSFQFAREVRRTRTGIQKDAPIALKYLTHTVSNGRFEAKSRAHTKLKPTEPGERSLRSMLVQVYGESA